MKNYSKSIKIQKETNEEKIELKNWEKCKDLPKCEAFCKNWRSKNQTNFSNFELNNQIQKKLPSQIEIIKRSRALYKNNHKSEASLAQHYTQKENTRNEDKNIQNNKKINSSITTFYHRTHKKFNKILINLENYSIEKVKTKESLIIPIQKYIPNGLKYDDNQKKIEEKNLNKTKKQGFLIFEVKFFLFFFICNS